MKRGKIALLGADNHGNIFVQWLNLLLLGELVAFYDVPMLRVAYQHLLFACVGHQLCTSDRYSSAFYILSLMSFCTIGWFVLLRRNTSVKRRFYKESVTARV